MSDVAVFCGSFDGDTSPFYGYENVQQFITTNILLGDHLAFVGVQIDRLEELICIISESKKQLLNEGRIVKTCITAAFNIRAINCDDYFYHGCDAEFRVDLYGSDNETVINLLEE